MASQAFSLRRHAKINQCYFGHAGPCAFAVKLTGRLRSDACLFCIVFDWHAQDGISKTSCDKKDNHDFCKISRGDKYDQQAQGMNIERRIQFKKLKRSKRVKQFNETVR